MPYSYYGYGDFLANNIYVILLIPVLLPFGRRPRSAEASGDTAALPTAVI